MRLDGRAAEPVTSPIVSDSQACANIARATRQKHSRFARSPAHFRNSLFFAFDLKKQPFRLFFLRQLPTSPRQGACSVGMQMDINHDVTGGALPRSKKKRPHSVRSFLFGSPDRAWTCDIMINSHALYRLSYRGICVGLALSSRTASSRVFSAPHSLTSVFGMGTGGPCALWRPTLC